MQGRQSGVSLFVQAAVIVPAQDATNGASLPPHFRSGNYKRFQVNEEYNLLTAVVPIRDLALNFTKSSAVAQCWEADVVQRVKEQFEAAALKQVS